MAEKSKLPRRIAGVKAPKELRKGGALRDHDRAEPRRLRGDRDRADAGGGERERCGGTRVSGSRYAAVARGAGDAPAPGAARASSLLLGAVAKPDAQQMAEAFGQVAEQVLVRLFGGKR